jgi:hypothetical protein
MTRGSLQLTIQGAVCKGTGSRAPQYSSPGTSFSHLVPLAVLHSQLLPKIMKESRNSQYLEEAHKQSKIRAAFMIA